MRETRGEEAKKDTGVCRPVYCASLRHCWAGRTSRSSQVVAARVGKIIVRGLGMKVGKQRHSERKQKKIRGPRSKVLEGAPIVAGKKKKEKRRERSGKERSEAASAMLRVGRRPCRWSTRRGGFVRATRRTPVALLLSRTCPSVMPGRHYRLYRSCAGSIWPRMADVLAVAGLVSHYPAAP
jgi:hypothetical protein